MFLSHINLMAQSQGCVGFSSNSENLNPTVFSENTCVKINSNTTIGTLTVGTSTTVEVPKGVVFTVNQLTSSTNQYLELKISGTVRFKQKLDVNSNIKIVVNEGGKFIVGGDDQNPSNIEFKGFKTVIENNGTLNVSTVDFPHNSENTITNNAKGIFNIKGSINIKGITIFQNLGRLLITQNYSNNKTSTYINCGYMSSGAGFNLGGGNVNNTGEFVVLNGSVNLNDDAMFVNKGITKVFNTIEGGGSFLNEGRLIVNQFRDLKVFKGPYKPTEKGFVYVVNKTNPNSMKIGANLEFRKIDNLDNLTTYESSSNYSTVFNNEPSYVNSEGVATNQSGANVTFGNNSISNLEKYTNIPCSLLVASNQRITCTKPGNYQGEGLPSSTGISTQVAEKSNWPNHVTNGQLVLSSASKGLVLTRTTPDKITQPVNGMLIYDTDAKCIKMFSPRGWNCLVKSCND